MALFQKMNIVAGLLKKEQKLELTLKEQGLFLVRMSEMLENGFTLTESLKFLSRFHKAKSAMFQSMIGSLQNGMPIHDVFYRHHFDRQVCTQIYFADKHGYLAAALHSAGSYALRKNEERGKLIQLLQYPLLLFMIVIVVGILLKTLLFPRFQMLYDSMDYEPDGSIAILLHLLQHLPTYFLIIVFTVCIGLTAASLSFRKKTAIEKAEFLSAIPVISSFYKLIQTVFLSREWSFLLKSGFSMNEIISIMEAQNYRPLLKESAEEIKGLLTVGYSFAEALTHLPFIEREMVMIVAHGEKNGRLDAELLYYSQFCLQRMEAKTLKIFQIMQPVIFSVIGFMVIAVYMSILMPMFQMLQTI